MADMEKKVAQFVTIRDIIKGIEDKCKDEVADWKRSLEKLRGELQAFMTENNLENLRTGAGTCYTSSKTTASLADPQAFMDYVIEHKAFDLIERRAKADAVKDFVKEHKSLPPGCNLNTIETLNVTRGSGSKDD